MHMPEHAQGILKKFDVADDDVAESPAIGASIAQYSARRVAKKLCWFG
jgi:hypothetical protein